MPYRRLPNTDQARIRALKSVVKKEDEDGICGLAVSLKTLVEARNFLSRFEAAHKYYKQCYANQSALSVKYQALMGIARMYVSHFIQVLNLAVIRSEIKKQYKELYGLPVHSNTVPDLSGEASLLEWGAKIVKGEKERQRQGGIPIYNPTIAKVSVHYDIFKDSYERQLELREITKRSLKSLAGMRKEADRIILDIWNQVEGHFSSLLLEQKLEKCRAYGIVYYYRKGEKREKS